jgi:hypothetical protein
VKNLIDPRRILDWAAAEFKKEVFPLSSIGKRILRERARGLLD